MRLKLFVAAVALLCASPALYADTITSTLGNGFDAGTIGTFTYMIPAGETITGATVTIDAVDVDFFPGVQYYLGGTYLGVIGAPGGSETFTVSNPSSLSSGSAVLSAVEDYASGLPLPFYSDNPTLTITTTDAAPPPPPATTPEPSSFLLLGTGLMGVAGVVRKRFA